MRIFVTGASGFVGGAAVRKLVRGWARCPRHVALGEERRQDRARSAASRCAAIWRMSPPPTLATPRPSSIRAAFVEQWGPRDAWRKFNVDGTARMLKAARDAGAKRFIHIGTEAALFHGQHLRGVDETYPLAPNSPYPYSSTKAQAEQLVRAANAPGFETIVLRPRFIWGPGDTTLLPLIDRDGARGQVHVGEWRARR